MSALRAWAVACVVLTGWLPLAAANDPHTVDLRFHRPLDVAGNAVPLVQNENRAGTAFVFLSPDGSVSPEAIAELNRLAGSPSAAQVALYGVISDRAVSRAAAGHFAREQKCGFPVIFDAAGALAELFRPGHVPQAFVVNAAGQVVYEGRIDNRQGEAEPTERDLADAITRLASGALSEPLRSEAGGAPFADRAAVEGDVTYARHIAPILYAHCVECHRPGQVAPFSLLSYDDAAKRAAFLGEVTSQGVMPPWRATIGFGHFLDERKLTDAEIALVARWAAGGAARGDAADMPPEPQFASGWRLGTPDLVLEAPGEVTVPADGADVFHHWVIPIELPEDKVLAGFEFRPGNPAVVHHALIALDSVGGSRRLDEATPEPGYTSSGSLDGSITGLVGIWTPGVTPRRYPENVGLHMRKKIDLLLQLHLHPSGKTETDRSQVALYFHDKPPEGMKTQSVLLTGSLMIKIAPGDDNYKISTSMRLPAEVTLSSVMPHFHLIGREMKLEATLPSGQVEPLIWIKDWNFYWQDMYFYKKPVVLPRGTLITMEASYDNSANNPFNPRNPPAKVLFGNDSDEEMCFAIFQAIDDRGDVMRKIAPAMLNAFVKEWNAADLTDEEREHIVDELVKLSGDDGGDMLKRLLLGNRAKSKPATP